ncbi:MAG TPA: RNA methyltransferase [Bacteroidota bacterium]|nr:RNA methyltransferase [Bacteroidota bacterium]
MRKHSLETITERRRERLEGVLRRRQTGLTIVLENVWDPHNVSAILRSADATGVHRVHLLYTIETPPDLVKHGKLSSASARKWLEFTVHDSVESCFAALRAEGFRIYASHLTREAISLHAIDFREPTALIVGNEHRGVSDEACAQSDGIYYIPMMGMVESLNVSVASAVSLYEGMRQRVAAGLYDAPQLDAAAFDAALRDWAQR